MIIKFDKPRYFSQFYGDTLHIDEDGGVKLFLNGSYQAFLDRVDIARSLPCKKHDLITVEAFCDGYWVTFEQALNEWVDGADIETEIKLFLYEKIKGGFMPSYVGFRPALIMEQIQKPEFEIISITGDGYKVTF